VLDSYGLHVKPSVSVASLAVWLSEHSHPRLIEEHIHDRLDFVAFEDLPAELQADLQVWTRDVSGLIDTPEYTEWEASGTPFLSRLKETVTALHRRMK
jgi:hypothetical protein